MNAEEEVRTRAKLLLLPSFRVFVESLLDCFFDNKPTSKGVQRRAELPWLPSQCILCRLLQPNELALLLGPWPHRICASRRKDIEQSISIHVHEVRLQAK